MADLSDNLKKSLTNLSVQSGVGLLLTVVLLFIVRPRTKEGGIALGILVVVACNLIGTLARFILDRIRRRPAP